MKQTILVVEDEKEIADTLTYALASEGFSPIWAPSVQAAQTAFSEQEVNLGIFDVGLPDGNGFELLKHIRQTGNQMPVIFCLLYTSPSPRDLSTSRMPSSA